MFAIAAATVLLGLTTVLATTPGTANMLHQVQTGALTVPLVLTLDGLGLTVVILLSVIAVRLENRSLDSFGLPVTQERQPSS